MKFFKIFVLLLIILLICLRIALPYYLIGYVENQINKIPEYRVKIADLDVHLIRGAYTIKNIQLWKITKNIPVPFYSAKTMDFSIEWAALWHGKLVAKITVQEPNINFVTDPSGNNEQLSLNKQWLTIVKSLYPLNINRLDAHNGQISLISYKGNPPYKIYITNTEFSMRNMQKATEEDKTLSSSFFFKGDAKGGGNFDLQGKFNPFAKTPVFDLQAKLTSLKVAQISSFLKHYSSVDVAGGTFSMYSEVAAAKGKITGYIKPFIKDLQIAPPKGSGPITAIVDGAASLVAKIVENPKQKTIATKINIYGDIDDPDTSIWSIIGYFIRHGFIQALLPQVDNTVKMQDLVYGRKAPTTYQYRN